MYQGSTRVTNGSMTNIFLRDVNRTLTTITDLQHQISTGKRVSFPSDDPIAADRILDYRDTLAKITQHVDNISQANSLASNVDGTLGGMEDVLLRARDLALTGSNEAPENQQARDAIAEEIDSLAHQVWDQSNSKYDGKFLFSGFKTDTMPFTISNELEFTTVPGGPTNTVTMPTYTIDGVTRTSQAITATDSVKDVLIYDKNTATWDSVFSAKYNATAINSDPVNNNVTIVAPGGPLINNGTQVRLVFDKDVSVKYNGDIGTRDVEINDGTNVNTSFAGAVSNDSQQRSVFGKYSAEGTQSSSVEAFQYLFDLRDSLFKYPSAGPNAQQDIAIQQIHQGIDDIDKIRENISNIRAEQGGLVNRLDLAKNRLSQMQIDTKALLSKQEDVDMTEALSQFALQQNVYQAALGVGAKIIQTTLLDFLR